MQVTPPLEKFSRPIALEVTMVDNMNHSILEWATALRKFKVV